MPTAPKLDWPQGQPLFEVQWRAVAESLAGNGVVQATDLEVTATATDLEIQVAAGDVFYQATTYNLGAAETHTLSAGDGTYDRWDTVYFDTATATSDVREGTPAADPEPPDITGDELLLAIVYVPQNATDVPDSDVLNWRARFSNEAEDVQYNDTPGVYPGNSVADALDELQEAAQITAYPLAQADLATGSVGSGEIIDGSVVLSDLASPFPLPSITDMDMSGTDLTDSAGPGVVYDASAGVVLQSVLGGPASSLSAYPLLIGTDVAAHLDGNDLLASSGGSTVYDTSAGWVPRAQQENDKSTHSETASGTNSSYTTAGDEVVLVDTATNTTPYTVTLASADAVAGREVTVVDVGGGAALDPITADTEGSENIDGGANVSIRDNYGSLEFESDGTNWYVTGGASSGEDVRTIIEGTETGNVPTTDQGILVVDNLADGETVRIKKAVLTTATVEAIPTGIDLELVTFDNAGSFNSQSTLVTGDGATVHDRVTGTPIASYENTTGSAQSIGVLVDNTTGSDQEVVAKATGDIY
ncbi:baseplate protein [Haloarcula californiae tailed virus 2]|uniref:Uncharacterized protein n=1 Tax=Haloarcula californiae tailed virus 2 TaxID=1273747 RepID=R4TM77_9CAUD|nr:baseplate protein [Haloarcula californiae tailed virus 2]AGM11827.1 hypothetical protein HCTV2_58 [Haloarcula californiae tailed virus 2]